MKKLRPALLLPLLFALVAVLVVGAAAYEWLNGLPEDARARYVGGAACIDCHQEQYELFDGSHHDRAMDVANDETVLARFDGSQLEHYGVTSTMFKSGERFMVNTEAPDGTMQDFEVKYVFGCEPLQQFMVETKASSSSDAIGQLQVLRLSWDVGKEEWFYLSPWDVNEKIEPDDPLHWTGITQRWNTSCASCHSTNLQKDFNPLSGSYATTFTDIDVNCEACHGPGSLHVEIANNRRFFWDRNHGYGLAKLKGSDNLPQIETCAPCHSRRGEVAPNFKAGDRFDDHYACQLLSNGIYHADGQILEEDYVYGSFIQSKMFHQGIRCTDCHDPHSAKVKFDDNQLCTSCHQHPAGKYDSPSHHRHQPGSAGAMCVECHMPATTYMEVDPRRDHSLRVPRPDLSVSLGTPNACTACHLDEGKLPAEEREKIKQYQDWLVEVRKGNSVVSEEVQRVDAQMAAAFNEWYPDAASKNERSKYYEQLAAAKSSVEDGDKLFSALAVDRSAPAIFRASAMESLLSSDSETVLATAESGLEDKDPKVAAAALRVMGTRIDRIISRAGYDSSQSESLRRLRKIVKSIDPMLVHEFQRVRAEAARVISSMPRQWRTQLSSSFDRQAYERELKNYKTGIRADNDHGTSHAMLGTLAEMEGDLQGAENSYRTAIAVEPGLSRIRTNLAALIDEQAEQIRDRILRMPPEADKTALGRKRDALTADARKLRVEENGLLKREVARAENISGVHDLHYRYGLSCYLLGDQALAEKHLVKAYEQSPEFENYVLALATFYNESSQFSKAVKFARELIALDGDNQGYRRLLEQIRTKYSAENKDNK